MDRIEQQRATLGEEGLAKKGKQVAEAMAANEVPPPDEMLTSIPVPSTDGIKFHPVEIFKATGDGKNPAGLDLKKLPVYAEAYNLHTNFCYVSIYLFIGNYCSRVQFLLSSAILFFQLY